MSIKNSRQLKNTLEKLAELEKLYQEAKAAPARNERVKELTLRSFKQTMNELREEIGRFRAHIKAGTP